MRAKWVYRVPNMMMLVRRAILRPGVWLIVAAVWMSFTSSFAASNDEPTRILVVHNIHVMVQIPASWQYEPDPTGFGGYGGADGGKLQWTIIPWEDGMTIERACQVASEAHNLFGSNPTVEFIQAAGQSACKITPSNDASVEAKNRVELVVHHPQPFDTFFGHIEYVGLVSDDLHFEAITESLDFAPEHVTPADYLAAVLDFVQKNSYYRAKVDWDALRQQMIDPVQGETDLSAARDRMSDLIAALKSAGDYHSHYIRPIAVQQILSAATADLSAHFPKGKRLTETIGYIELEGVQGSPEIARQYAETGQGVIRQLDEAPVACWIIDLRHDGGGNMYPMLATVAPILGDGVIEQFVGGSSPDQIISMQGGRFFWNGVESDGQMIEKSYSLHRPNPPVAVLIGGETVSSGENVAVAFVGRPRTRLFGSGSYGLTIGNSTMLLFDGGALALATFAAADRNGNAYTNGVKPDEYVLDNSSPVDSPENPVMAAALAWLTKEQGC